MEATVLPGLVAEKRKNGGKEPEQDKYPDKSRGTGAKNQSRMRFMGKSDAGGPNAGICKLYDETDDVV